jgi:hypothetical protein
MGTPNRMVPFIGMGFEIVGLVMGSVWIGKFLDDRYNGKGLFTAGVVVLSLVAWFIHLVMMLRRMDPGGGDEE